MNDCGATLNGLKFPPSLASRRVAAFATFPAASSDRRRMALADRLHGQGAFDPVFRSLTLPQTRPCGCSWRRRARHARVSSSGRSRARSARPAGEPCRPSLHPGASVAATCCRPGDPPARSARDAAASQRAWWSPEAPAGTRGRFARSFMLSSTTSAGCWPQRSRRSWSARARTGSPRPTRSSRSPYIRCACSSAVSTRRTISRGTSADRCGLRCGAVGPGRLRRRCPPRDGTRTCVTPSRWPAGPPRSGDAGPGSCAIVR